MAEILDIQSIPHIVEQIISHSPEIYYAVHFHPPPCDVVPGQGSAYEKELHSFVSKNSQTIFDGVLDGNAVFQEALKNPFIVGNMRLDAIVQNYVKENRITNDTRQNNSLQSKYIEERWEAADIFVVHYCIRARRDLYHVKLQERGIGPAELKNLSQSLSFHHTLISLNLAGNPLGSAGAQCLAGILTHLKKLQSLKLPYCSLGDGGIKIMSSTLRDLPDLRYLTLDGNDIGAVGMKYLSPALKNMKKLVILQMRCNDLGVRPSNLEFTGFDFLIDALPDMHALEQLHVSHNKITDAGFERLARDLHMFGHIKFVFLEGRQNEISQHKQYAIMEALQTHRYIRTTLRLPCDYANYNNNAAIIKLERLYPEVSVAGAANGRDLELSRTRNYRW